ncbi:hypothetical protein CKA32_003134 [Geitlerinema sp. FC II]|nr:hypothetical protein CKA32_003134 [Geitlerinema sp. FC II]
MNTKFQFYFKLHFMWFSWNLSSFLKSYRAIGQSDLRHL